MTLRGNGANGGGWKGYDQGMLNENGLRQGQGGEERSNKKRG